MRAMWTVVCVTVVVALCAPAPAVESFDTLLPEDTVFCLSVRDVPDLLAKIKETAGYKIFKQLRLFERVAPADKFAEMKEFYGRFIEPIGAICSGEVALAIVSLDDIDENPEFVLLVDVSEGEAALKEYLDGTIYPLLEEQGIKPEELMRGGARFTKIVPDPDEPAKAIFFAVKDGVLMVALRDETLAEVLSARGVGIARAMLPANKGYADVQRALGDADMSVYVNLGAILGKSLQEGDEEGKAILKALGFDNVRGAGLGMSVGAGGGSTVVRLSTDGPPTGWLGAFARRGGPFKSLKYVPDDAGFYYVLNLGSFLACYEEFVVFLEAVSEETGEDALEEFAAGVEKLEVLLAMDLEEEILPAFGGEIALSAKVPEALGIPPAALLIEVKDKEMVERLVARVFELLETFSEGTVRLTTAKHGGIEITTVLASPAITPGVAVLDDFLVVGTHPEVVRAIIDTASEGTNIEKKKDFRTTMSALPTSGTAMMYIDFKEVYEFVFPLLAVRVRADGRIGELIKDLGKVGEHLSGFGAVVTGDESGLTYRVHSPNALLEPTLLIGAGMVLPALGRAREAAQGAGSMNNVKQLCLAMMMYAQDHDDRLPERLSDLALYVGDPSVFVHPKNRKKAKLIDLEKPVTIDEHSDYELVLKGGKLSEIEDPAEAVVIRENREFSKGRRVVGYADGHVTNVPPGAKVFDHIRLDEE